MAATFRLLPQLPASQGPAQAMAMAFGPLRRLAALLLALVLSVTVTACSGASASEIGRAHV